MSPSPPYERWVEFLPAYDRRHPDPDKNYGIHGVEMAFYLRGPKGAIQFKVYTAWQLPHVDAEQLAGPHSRALCRPLPVDLGYHSPVARYEGQEPISDDCPILGGRCWYDGSGLRAQPVFDRLVAEGDPAVWRYLEDEYEAVFGEVAADVP